eukprot:COSAG04_NODE_10274_length_790_cov_1.843705_2_plen_129_part_01
MPEDGQARGLARFARYTAMSGECWRGTAKRRPKPDAAAVRAAVELLMSGPLGPVPEPEPDREPDREPEPEQVAAAVHGLVGDVEAVSCAVHELVEVSCAVEELVEAAAQQESEQPEPEPGQKQRLALGW